MVDERLVEALAFLGGAVGDDSVNVFADVAQVGGAGCGWWGVEGGGEFGLPGAELLGPLGQLGEPGFADVGFHVTGFEGGQVAVDGRLGGGEFALDGGQFAALVGVPIDRPPYRPGSPIPAVLSDAIPYRQRPRRSVVR